MSNNEPAPVIFRVWTGHGKLSEHVFALFPTFPSDNTGELCTSYSHFGQHGGASYHHCIKNSRPARGKSLTFLRKELESIGYRLRIVKRASYAMHRERITTACDCEKGRD